MLKNRDVMGGLLLVSFGAFVVIYASRWNFGTLDRMGPGFLPVTFGVVLVLLGIVITFLGIASDNKIANVEFRSVLFITGSILVFGFVLKHGLVYASLSAAFIASFSERDSTLLSRVIMAILVTIVVVLLFRFALGMRLVLF